MPSLPVTLFVIIMYVIVGLLLLINFFRGMKQGSRKTAYRIGCTIVFWVVFFLTANFLSGRIIWESTQLFSLISKIPFLPQAEGATNLLEYIKLLVVNMMNMSPEALEDPSLDANIILMGQFIIKLLYMGVLRLVFGIATKIIYEMFVRKHCDFSEKTLDKLEAKQEQYIDAHDEPSEKLENMIDAQEKRVNRKPLIRGVGMLLGVVKGAISCFIILSFVNAMVFTLPDISEATFGEPSAGAEEVIDEETEIGALGSDSYLLTKMLYSWEIDGNKVGEWLVSAIKEYQSNFISRVSGLDVGGKRLDMIFVDGIFSGEYRDGQNTYRVIFRNDLAHMINVADDIAYATDGFDFSEGFDFFALSDEKAQRLQHAVEEIGASELLINLLPVAVSAMSTPNKDGNVIIPTDIVTKEELLEIDWAKDIKTLGSIIPKVIKLSESTADFDFFTMNRTVVEDIFDTLGEIQAINPIMKILTGVGLEQLYASEDLGMGEEVYEAVKADLADVVWTEDISDIGTLYGKFIDLGIKEKMDSYPPGTDPNYLEIFTSLSGNDVNPIVDTLFKLSFVENVLPDVVGLLREKIPEEYRDMLNPEVTTAQEWLDEINSVFDIIDAITERGTEPLSDFSDFNFEKLQSIRTETIVNSKLLSHLLISLLVKVSNGTLDFGAELGEYIKVPDLLRAKDENGVYTAQSWFENNTEHGELYYIVDTLKEIASSIDFSGDTDPGEIASKLINGIDADAIANSSVLQCTLSNLMITQLGSILQIPIASYDDPVAVGGVMTDVIKKSEIKGLLSALQKIDLNLSSLDSDLFGAITKSFEKEVGSETVFDEEKAQAIFSETGDSYSIILHATISKFITDFGDVGSGFSLKFPSGVIDSNSYIASEEIINLARSLYYLDIASLMEGSGAEDFFGALISNEHISEVLQSTVVRSAITGFFAESDFGLVIPEDEAVYDSGEGYVVEYSEGNALNNKVFTSGEIEAVFNALKVLKGDSSEGYSDVIGLGGLNLSKLSENADTLLESKIVHATISSKIVEKDFLKIGVNDDYETIGGRVIYDGTFIDAGDLKDLLESFSLICGDSVADMSFDTSSILGLSDEEIEVLFNSEIVVNTASVKIYEMFNDNPAIEFLSVEEDGAHGFSERTITRDEEIALYKGIKIFISGSQDLGDVSFDFEALTSLSDEDIDSICKSNILSYNVLNKIRTENSTNLNNMLVLDGADRRWYYENSLEGDNLNSLLKSLKKLYANDTFRSAFIEMQTTTSNFASLKDEAFIKTLTRDEVLCDSLPNIIENFTAVLDPRLHDIYREPYKTTGKVYVPEKSFFGTDDAWREWWEGTPNVSDGELYKLFDAIEAMNNIADAMFAYPPESISDDDIARAEASEIINETIEIPSAS
ncbi:MAG: hypothetical protein J6X75_04420 [Clostridia bacterium]|nr:hypothetical protein [Clostridia bacterium]